MIDLCRESEPRPHVTCWGMLPTPFEGLGAALDLGSLHRTAVQYVADGCDGLVVLGVIAEPATLSDDEKRQVIATVADLPVPVVAGALVGGPDQVLAEVARVFANSSGVTAVMVPVLHGDAVGLGQWLDQVHEAAGLPVIVQDLPRFTGVQIDIDKLADALVERPWVIGVKCEAEPTYLRIAQLAARGVPGLLSGFGGLGLVTDLTAGATGVAIGVTIPGAVVEGARQWTAGDDLAARGCVERWASRIQLETQQGPNIAIRKEHLRRRGLFAESLVRAPTPAWTVDLEALSVVVGA